MILAVYPRNDTSISYFPGEISVKLKSPSSSLSVPLIIFSLPLRRSDIVANPTDCPVNESKTEPEILPLILGPPPPPKPPNWADSNVAKNERIVMSRYFFIVRILKLTTPIII